MSQSLASRVRKLALPPLLCYSMQIEKKAKVWELDLMEQGQTTLLTQSEWHYKLFIGGWCELEQCSMGNKFESKKKATVL